MSTALAFDSSVSICRNTSNSYTITCRLAVQYGIRIYSYNIYVREHTVRVCMGTRQIRFTLNHTRGERRPEKSKSTAKCVRWSHAQVVCRFPLAFSTRQQPSVSQRSAPCGEHDSSEERALESRNRLNFRIKTDTLP